MSLPLAFHPDVKDEMDDAYRWYERQKPGLGDDFVAAIEEVFQRISVMPQAHSIVFQDIRRALPRRFPYGVFYRVEPDRVYVIAVYHSRRDPSGWQSRV